MSESIHIKTTLKHTAIYSASNMLQKAVSFIMLPLYANILGVEIYGTLQMIEVLTSVMGILTGYAIGTAINRFYFERQTEDEKNRLISTSVITIAFVAFAICLPVIVFNHPISRWIFGADGLETCLIMGVLTFMTDTTATSGQMYIMQKQQAFFFSLLSLIRLFIGLGLNILFIVYMRMGIMGVLYSNLITSFIYCLYVHVHTLVKTGISFNVADARQVIGYSLPMLPGYCAISIRSNADRFILSRYLGLAQLGVYSTVFKFSMLVEMIIHDPFMRIWVVKRMEIAETPDGPSTIAKVFTLFMAMNIFCGLILATEIPIIIRIMTPPVFWVNSAIAFCAVVSRIGFTCYFHFIFGVLYGKVTSKISILQFVMVGISVPMTMIMVKYWGVLGAYEASSSVYLLQCIVAHQMSKKYYKINYEWAKIATMIGIAVLLFIFINYIDIEHTAFNMWLNHSILPRCLMVGKWIHLETIKNGKLLALLNAKFVLVVESAVKALLTCLFIPCLIAAGIIRWSRCREIMEQYLSKNHRHQLFGHFGRILK